MKTLHFLPLVVMLCVTMGYAQTGTIAGRVLLPNDEGAANAIVTLEDLPWGASADGNGRFVITDVSPGTYRLKARLIGYEQGELLPVRVQGGDTVRVTIALRENQIEMSQILVTATRRQLAEDVRPSVTTITPREAKYLPGAAEDVLRGLQALPGVTSVNDFSAQLVVRGSGPDQNLIMIDGFEVINPYRLYGVVSMFNPETVSDISLQTGGFGVQYGDRLSAVLDVKNREGRSDVTLGAKLNFSLTNMNVIAEGGLPFDGSSYLLSFRRTYYDLILGPVLKKAKLVEGDVALPNFRDVQFRGSVPIDESNKVILNAFTSRDGVSLVSGVERDRADSASVFDESHNTMLGATWQYASGTNSILNSQLSWYKNTGDGVFDGTFVDPSQNSGNVKRIDTLGLRFVRFAVDYGYQYEKTSWSQRLLINAGTHSLEAGYGIDLLRTDFTRYFEIDQSLKNLIAQRGFVVPTSETQTLRYSRYNIFVQDRIAIGEKLFVQPGVRLDIYPVLGTSVYLSPRLNISYKLDDLSTLRAAVGLYHQSPGMEKEDFRSRVTFSDQAFASLRAERATHYILGYDRMLTPSWQVKVETYYKGFTNVIVPQKLEGGKWFSQFVGDSMFSPRAWTAPVRVATDSLTPFPVNDASGESYGFEVMLQKIRSQSGDRFTGWVSYALSYAERTRDGRVTPFLFDQRHAMNIVGNYRLGESWDLGVRFTLRSGRPYSKALGVKPRVLLQRVNGEDLPVIQTNQDGKVILDVEYERDSFSGRLNLYHTLDVRLTTYPGWWGLNWAIYLDVQNVYNRSNQQAINAYIDERGQLRERAINGIPLFPSLGMSVTF